MLDEPRAFIPRFVVATPDELDIITLWVAHTHAIEASSTTPRLAALSPLKGCGKSRLLEVLNALCRDATLNTNISPAALWRTVDAGSPTVLLDEVDAIFSPNGRHGKDDLRALINAGYRRGQTVMRATPGKGDGVRAWNTFAPVALAGIGDCLPPTILDRSIVIRLRRRTKSEPIEDFYARGVDMQAAALSRKLAYWYEARKDDIERRKPTVPAQLGDRRAELWRPLLAIAEDAGQEWAKRARRIAVALSPEDEVDPAERLLADLRDVFRKDAQVASADLVQRLRSLDDAPWRSTGFDAHKMAKMLRPFGIRSSQQWLKGKNTRCYARADFQDAWARYLP